MGRGRRSESKVIYQEGDHIRAVRGRVKGWSKDGLFLIIERRDGTLRLAKSTILKIEEGR